MGWGSWRIYHLLLLSSLLFAFVNVLKRDFILQIKNQFTGNNMLAKFSKHALFFFPHKFGNPHFYLNSKVMNWNSIRDCELKKEILNTAFSSTTTGYLSWCSVTSPKPLYIDLVLNNYRVLLESYI